jgi:hypothetical protein
MAKVAGAAGTRAKFLTGTGMGVEKHAMALWVLTALELLALVALRRYFKRQHGG